MATPPTIRRRAALVFFLVALVHVALVRRFWFLTDDAYISFRYMRNWGSGAGLRYNLGDHVPVEGYSNFLLVAVGALVQRLGGAVEHVIPALTALCGLGLLALVFRTLRRSQDTSLTVAGAATLMLAVCTPFCVWSTSGLETMSYALCFFWAFERLVLRVGGPAPLQAGLLGLGLALGRVEGLYWALLFAALTLLAGRLRRTTYLREVGAYVATVLAPYAAYFLWRYLHFDALVATTVEAKVAFGLERLLRGLQYVAVQDATNPILLAVVPAAFVALRARRRDTLGLVWLLCIGVSAYALVVGGDFMTFGRLLVPGLAPLALLWGALLDSLERRCPRSALPTLATGAAGIVLAAMPGWDLHLVPEGVRARLHFRLNTDEYASEFQQWRTQRRRAAQWSARGAILAALAAPDDSIVLSAIGATGYYSKLFVFDTNGFVTPEVARREVTGSLTGARSPGHDKSVEDTWFLEHGHRPTILRTKLLGTPWGAREEGDALALNVKRMATALEDEGLRERYAVEFYRIRHPAPAVDVDTYLIVARAIPEGADPEVAWSRFHAAVARYRADGSLPELEVDYPTEFDVPALLRRGWEWLEVPDASLPTD